MTWGEQNTQEEAHEQLNMAFEHGVNFLDTAEMYPVAPRAETQGETSTYIGHWLRHRKRDHVIVATKVAGRGHMEWIPASRTEPRGEEQPTVLDAKSIRTALEAELRRLQTDYVDLFQLHWPDRYKPGFGTRQYKLEREHEYTPFDEQVEEMGRLIKEGKVRYWGLSNETTFGVMSHCQAADQQGVPRPVSIQNCFNLLHRTFETELAEACSPSHLNISLLPWSALAGGALSAKYLNDAKPPGARLTRFPKRYDRWVQPLAAEATAEYAKLARQAGITPAQLAYAFCKSRWFIPSTIIGATSLEQLAENLATADITLEDDMLQAIDEIQMRYREPTLTD
ncbi:hypothetical protein WJX72_009319 [[Myrmecia] bisecta]|uniref:NADP-dependent oxidoreductase domain-containing protein n=1 Tax=[Myrmecia] bisecta TaxID=41462 RepID=A0AAW1PUZ5_9CHLO